MGPLVHGDYPVVMKQRIASKSVGEGRNSSRLPEFTLEERNTIKGNLEEFNISAPVINGTNSNLNQANSNQII